MWFSSIQTLTLQMDDVALDCVRFGSGNKPLVIIPGLGLRGVRGSGLLLAYMYRIFTKEFTVYVLDKRAESLEGCTIRNMAKDTACAMERLGLCSADVFGVSMGGMIAQYLAIDYPQLVNRLVLGVTAAKINKTMEDTVSAWIKMAEENDFQAIVMDMAPKMYSPAYLKKYRALLPFLAKTNRSGDLSRFAALARACLTCNAYPELEKITCPAFVIGGKQDKVLTGEASEEIAAALGCGLYLYPELGHAAYEEAPDYNQKIYQFLTEIS